VRIIDNARFELRCKCGANGVYSIATAYTDRAVMCRTCRRRTDLGVDDMQTIEEQISGHRRGPERDEGGVSDAALPSANSEEMLRSIAPDGLCKSCIGVAFKLSPKALRQELDVLSHDPAYDYRKGRCHRSRAPSKLVVRLVTAGVDL